MSLAGSRTSAPEPLSPLPGRSNYFIGPDPARWRAGIPHFAGLCYRAVYPGIDLLFHGAPAGFEYDFTVAPGADPGAIRVRFRGASRVALEGDDLVVRGGAAELRHHRPVVYQESAGARRYVTARYRLRGGAVSFELGPYDRTRALVIDPVLTWAAYVGGSDADSSLALAVDSAGNPILAGSTLSGDFPGTRGGLKPSIMAGFVAKLDARTSSLLFATYIAGAAGTGLTGVALDAAGNIVVTGTGAFAATSGAYQTPNATGFVAKLGPNGDKLLFASAFTAAPEALALDSKDNIYVTGEAVSGFQTTAGVVQPAYKGGTCSSSFTGSGPCPDAFVLKLSADGAKALYATYLGGSYEDGGHAIAVDPLGQAYIGGDTASQDFPVTPGAAQSKFGGRVQGWGDAFVAKIDPNGANLIYATWLGGAAPDVALGIAIDANGNAYLAGETQSDNFPVTQGAFRTKYGGGTPIADGPDPAGDAFAAKFSVSGALLWSTYLGGAGRDTAAAVTVDRDGNVYVAGSTESADFPKTAGAVPSCRTVGGPFVTKLDPNGAKVLQSTGASGMGFDQAFAMALDSPSKSSPNVYLAGETSSRVFFSTGVAAQKTYGGGDSDAFVAKFDLNSPTGLFVACVLNGASFQPGNASFFPLGTVAPGEIVSVFGVGLGPDQPALAQPSSSGLVSTRLGGTQVLFDGVAAPLLYVGPNQINAVVPYGVRAPVTQITVQRGGTSD